MRASSFYRSIAFYSPQKGLASTEWVYNRLGSVKILDVTRHITPKKNGYQEFLQKRIPGSQYLNLNTVCERDGYLIKKLPTPEEFKAAVEELGISSTDEVILYDNQGIYSAARAWYMFKVFNKDCPVYVMNGGLIRWETEKYPIEFKNMSLPKEKGKFDLNPDFSLVASLDDIKERIERWKKGEAKRTVIDCRRNCCYTGTCKIPIAHVPKGHIPGSVNIPFHSMTDPYNNYMIREPDELITIFEKNGVYVNETEKMLFSCDHGLSSCVDLFAMYLLGRPLEGCAVYDGSWVEYALQKDTSKVL